LLDSSQLRSQCRVGGHRRLRPVDTKRGYILRLLFDLGCSAIVAFFLKLLTGQLPSWQAYQDRGIKRDAAGDHVGAAADFGRAIRLYPPHPALHFLRGVSLLHAAAPQEAAVEFEQGLKLDPNNATLQGLLDTSRLTCMAPLGKSHLAGCSTDVAGL